MNLRLRIDALSSLIEDLVQDLADPDNLINDAERADLEAELNEYYTWRGELCNQPSPGGTTP